MWLEVRVSSSPYFRKRIPIDFIETFFRGYRGLFVFRFEFSAGMAPRKKRFHLCQMNKIKKERNKMMKAHHDNRTGWSRCNLVQLNHWHQLNDIRTLVETIQQTKRVVRSQQKKKREWRGGSLYQLLIFFWIAFDHCFNSIPITAEISIEIKFEEACGLHYITSVWRRVRGKMRVRIRKLPLRSFRNCSLGYTRRQSATAPVTRS